MVWPRTLGRSAKEGQGERRGQADGSNRSIGREVRNL